MAEVITLTTPILQTTIRIDRVILEFEKQSVTILWLGNNGEPGQAMYPTPLLKPATLSGATLITQINGGNFTSVSLVKWLFQRLQTDKFLAPGTITGTPV